MEIGDLITLLPDSNIDRGFGVPVGARGMLLNFNTNGDYWKIYWLEQDSKWEVYTKFLKKEEWTLEELLKLKDNHKDMALAVSPHLKKEFIGGA